MKQKYLLLALMGLVLALPGCQGCPIAAPPAPYPPSDLAGVTISSSEINLTWKDNSLDETGFYIYRKTTDNYSKMGVMEANATSHTDTGLSPQTTYSYKVTAYNEGGESDPSNEVTITTPAEASAPSAPSDLAGQAISCSEINLTWQDNSTNEDGFYVYRKTTDHYSIIATMEANATSYNNTGLNPETAYSYKISAYNDIGESGFSNALCVHTPAESLEAPSNVMAEAVSYKQINLTWQDNSDDEDTFRINSDFGLGPGNNQFLARVPANTTNYEDCNLQPMREYKYFVMAERNGERACSERFWATTPSPVSAIIEMVWPYTETFVTVHIWVISGADELCRVEAIVSVTDYNHNFRGSTEATFELVEPGWSSYSVEVPIVGGSSKFYATIEITDVEILY